MLVEVSDIPYGVPLRIPHSSGSRFEAELAAANELSRRKSIERLGRRFPGYDFEAAAQNVDDRRFAALEIGSALLDELDGVASVERTLATRDHVWGLGGISFTHADIEGHHGPPPGVSWTSPAAVGDRGWLNAGRLVDALDDRWTAIINGADRFDPRLAAVCADLASAYGSRINTNVYISHADAEGFGPHWDTHDTIIVPVHGRKTWSIFEPKSLSAPQRPWVGTGVSDRPLWSGELVPGGALVIPRGWGHEVTHRDDLSIHYTIGISRLEVHHVFERVGFEAGFDPKMRADFPYDLRAPADSYAESVFDEPHGFARETAGLLTAELLERALATYRARINDPVFTPLERTFRAAALRDWTGVGVRVGPPGGVMLAEDEGEQAVVAYGNRAVRIHRDATAAFAALANGEPRPPDELPALTIDGEDQRLQFASQLVRHGAATVEPLGNDR